MKLIDFNTGVANTLNRDEVKFFSYLKIPTKR